MRWLLCWWIIAPGHSQVVHYKNGFETERACIDHIVQVAPANKPVHWHCSKE